MPQIKDVQTDKEEKTKSKKFVLKALQSQLKDK